MNHRGRGLAVALLALLMGFAGITGASAAPADRLDGTAQGMEATARWWQAVLAGAVSFDDSLTGANCATFNDDTGAPVVIAFGTWGGASGPRACAVPAGATIVLPAINMAWSITDPAGPWQHIEKCWKNPEVGCDTLGEGRAFNREWASSVTASATVDGAAVEPRSIQSARFLLRGDLYGLDPNRLLPTVSAGYWLVVRLPAGSHTVTTHGANSATGFFSSTNYTFTVG